ncbi:MAG TPA: molybdopterin oxidoreductase, partial [Desulfomonilia bacterium]|nr:molybdopterin oxidoreductase [Desulfomonilia bacterium]
MSTGTFRSICFECHSRCGVILEVENGKLAGVKGDPDHPHSHGYTCPKGRAAPEMIYHPDRITRPLVKVGPRTGTRFEEASWDKALGIIAGNLLSAKDK